MGIYIVYLSDSLQTVIVENIGAFLDERYALQMADFLNRVKPDTITGQYRVMPLKLETATAQTKSNNDGLTK